MHTQNSVTAPSTSPLRFIVSLALLVGMAGLTASETQAQETGLATASMPLVDDEAESGERVNRALMIVGATLFVGSYAPSVAFATLGDWNADDALVIPVAGPWIALANPENQPLSKALLINSGVMQGAGVVSMALSLVIPSYSARTTLRFGKSELRLLPSEVARGAYGLGAVGSF